MEKTFLGTVLTAIVSLAIGAVLQYLRERRAEMRKQVELLRASAYADFIRGVSLIATTHHTDFPQPRLFEGMALVAESRARIALYGSEAAVKAMVGVSEHPELTTRKACGMFVRACRQMRVDTQASADAISDEELSLVVFGRTLANMPE